MDAKKSKIADFFSREYQALTGFVRRWLADEASREAEDIVQDVLVSLYDRANVMAPIADLSAYVYGALKHKIKDAYRAGRIRAKTKLDPLDQAGETLASLIQQQFPDAAQLAERAEMQEHLYAAIAALNADERALISATEFAGISYRQLAQEWQVPIGTLLSRKARALDKIKKTLAPYMTTSGGYNG